MVQDIIQWRESLTRLPDHHFFDLMRMYLGEVKTPFNKQKLIESLSAFLRKPENKNSLMHLLDKTDILILSAVCCLPQVTQEKLAEFFSDTFKITFLYDRLLNLEERLILYRFIYEKQQFFAINPLIADVITPITGMHILLPEISFSYNPEQEQPPITGIPLPINEITLAAIFTFFIYNKDTVKNDGTLKKKTEQELKMLFPVLFAKDITVSLLLSALRNLSLLRQEKNSLIPDFNKWYSFAQLPDVSRYAYLTAAAWGRLTRDVMQKSAQVALDIIFSIPQEGGFESTVMYRSGFIQNEIRISGKSRVSEIAENLAKEGRFAAFLRSDTVINEQNIPNITGRLLIDSAHTFGLILKSGEVYYRNPTFIRLAESNIKSNTASDIQDEKKPVFVHIDGSFSVTILPGLPFNDLLKMVSFMEVRSVDTAGRFELTRRSSRFGFETGFLPDKIRKILESESGRGLPQNILFSIEEWYKSYKAVSLFHGYILKVEESRRIFVENSDILAPFIKTTLAPGIYLLNIEEEKEIADILHRSGLDFSGGTDMELASIQRENQPLPQLRISPYPLQTKEIIAPKGADISISLPLYDALEQLDIPREQKEVLRSRIERRIILNPIQLRPESVRFEKVEAEGMDFLGKVRVAEHAIISQSLIELIYEDSTEKQIFLGKPLSLEKKEGDAFLRIIIQPDEQEQYVSLGRASLVKRIRGAIFEENSYE